MAPEAQPAASEFYQLRRYRLQSGPQTHLAESYFAEALLPALGRLRMGPVGAFRLEMGPETPSFYLLIPSQALEGLVMLDLHLARDEAFLKAAEPFWSAPASSPAFARVDGTLLSAFPGWPRITPPASSAAPGRILQLRTYESPSYRDHVRKVEMFHDGEFAIFTKAGFRPVFFGDTLIGERMPSLTYLLAFDSMEQLGAQWKSFVADPAWKKLSTSPKYSFEELVSNISNLVLSPLPCSAV